MKFIAVHRIEPTGAGTAPRTVEYLINPADILWITNDCPLAPGQTNAGSDAGCRIVFRSTPTRFDVEEDYEFLTGEIDRAATIE